VNVHKLKAPGAFNASSNPNVGQNMNVVALRLQFAN
jgi:hypothetical protein